MLRAQTWNRLCKTWPFSAGFGLRKLTYLMHRDHWRVVRGEVGQASHKQKQEAEHSRVPWRLSHWDCGVAEGLSPGLRVFWGPPTLLVREVALREKRCSVSPPEHFFQLAEFSDACTSCLHCMQPYACLGERGKLVFSFQLFLLIIQT